MAEARDAPRPRAASSRGPSIWKSNCNKLSLSRIHCTRNADSSGTVQARLEPALLWSTRRFMHYGTVMNPNTGGDGKQEQVTWGRRKEETWTWGIQSGDLSLSLSFTKLERYFTLKKTWKLISSLFILVIFSLTFLLTHVFLYVPRQRSSSVSLPSVSPLSHSHTC